MTTTPTATAPSPAPAAATPSGTAAARRRRQRVLNGAYPLWFHVPAGVLFLVLFIVPTVASFYFSLTRWTLFDVEFIGLDNFVQFFREPSLVQGFTNTFIYAVVTSGLKVVLGLLLAILLTSQIIGRGYLRSVVFFPVLVSTIGIGVTFKVLLDPFDGMVNQALAVFGIQGPGWLTDPSLALLSVAFVDVWKGVGLATLIYIAGIVAIPQEYFEAAKVDGATAWQNFWNITLPLARPATVTVVILSLIGGLRSFDLIWAMTRGGPGFSSDVIASVIYKQYQAGFFGLSTAGNVVLFLVVAAIIIPIFYFLNRKSTES
ncbi:carbohydrate ABC transporter permease [Microbacterium hibisci]|uniref:carbohydrate ABC transporter permease n=1 Tax=Microbacterium hibisci TaxID=2036000 RepID=UPI0019422E8C|nr:sugar ABC transporter permease [Microbacterium hibisci]